MAQRPDPASHRKRRGPRNGGTRDNIADPRPQRPPIGQTAYRVTNPASWASNPACVRFAHSNFTSIRDT